jgi:Tol biopolymer transport system component
MKCLRTLHWLWLVLILAGCGRFEVGIEQTATPDTTLAATAAVLATSQAAQATQIAALESELGRLATQVAAPAVPTPETASEQLGWLAYVQGGDIYITALPDGEAIRLTTDGRNEAPRWSPSGNWLTFNKSDGSVWVIRADRTASRQIANASTTAAYRWSPNDDQLAYIHRDGWGIFVIASGALANEDPSGDGRLVFAQEVPDGYNQLADLTWSPSGDQLAFVVQPYSSDNNRIAPATIRSVGLNGEPATTIYTLTATPQDGLKLAGWTPESQGVLFWRDQGFAMADGASDVGFALEYLELGSSTPITLPAVTAPYNDFVSSTPNNPNVAVILGANYWTGDNKFLALFQPSSSTTITLTEASLVATTPVFAPDGTQLAYVAKRADDSIEKRRIWVRELGEGQRVQQITGDPLYRDEAPRWSADGSTLLFARMSLDGKTSSLWLVAASGGTPWQVVDELTPAPDPGGFYGQIDWAQLFDWWSVAP